MLVSSVCAPFHSDKTQMFTKCLGHCRWNDRGHSWNVIQTCKYLVQCSFQTLLKYALEPLRDSNNAICRTGDERSLSKGQLVTLRPKKNTRKKDVFLSRDRTFSGVASFFREVVESYERGFSSWYLPKVEVAKISASVQAWGKYYTKGRDQVEHTVFIKQKMLKEIAV